MQDFSHDRRWDALVEAGVALPRPLRCLGVRFLQEVDDGVRRGGQRVDIQADKRNLACQLLQNTSNVCVRLSCAPSSTEAGSSIRTNKLVAHCAVTKLLGTSSASTAALCAWSHARKATTSLQPQQWLVSSSACQMRSAKKAALHAADCACRCAGKQQRKAAAGYTWR